MTDLTLETETARDAVKRRLRSLAERALGAYGLDGRVTLLNHTINATWRVDARVRGAGGGAAGERQRFVLRLYRPDLYSPAAVRSEVAWLRALRAGEGLEVPAPVAAADGDALVTLAAEGETPRPGVLFRWLEGRFATGAPTPGQARRIGELLGRLHAFSDRFEEPEGFERPRFDLDGLLGAGGSVTAGADEGFLSRGDRRHLGEAAAYLRRELAGLEEQPGAFGLIHGDLTPKNCLFHDGEVRALDFADFGRGFYAYDVATSLLRWTEEEHYQELRTAFLAGYRRVRSFPSAQEAVIEDFQLCRHVYLLRWLCRFLELPEIRERARDGFPFILAQIRRFLDRRAASRPAGLSSLSTVEFLHRLHERDVELWAEEDRLRFSAPRGVLTGELKEELKRRKAEVLRFLRETVASTGLAGPPLVRVPRSGPLPLSFAQERLWFFDCYEPGNTVYNMSTLFRFRGPLQIVALASSLNEIVRRHEILRTTFHSEAGKPVQRVAPPRVQPLPVIDLARLPEAVRGPVAVDLARSLARRPFDLSRGPLLRFFVLRLAAREQLFQLTIHHIVFDGWSSDVLGRELRELHAAYLDGRFVPGAVSPLPELEIQYADFAHWQRQWLRGEILEQQLEHWRRALAGAPHYLELPMDRPRPALPVYSTRKLVRWLPQPLHQSLGALCQREGCTPFMALLAAFDVLLRRYTGTRDLLVGTQIANRNRAELERLIGFFANTLVLRARIARHTTFRELLEHVRQAALAAYEHQDLPFEKVVEAVHPDRASGHHPLVQVIFALQNTPATRPAPAGIAPEMSIEPTDDGQMVFDLAVTVHEAPAGLRLSVRYAEALFDRTGIARLAGHFQALLEALLSDPDQVTEGAEGMPPAERHQILGEWNDNVGASPARRFHELVARQARHSPDAAALVGNGRALSFGDLERRANRLARFLRRRGVGPEKLVGLCLERSFDAIVAILGVLKAGGAFLPIDSEYPRERLAYMLSDSATTVLVTRSDLLGRLPVSQSSESVVTVCLDRDRDRIEREDATDPQIETAPRNLAYLIYTSGSTGRPKGVMLDHGGMSNLVESSVLGFAVTPEDRVLAFAPLSFDTSIFEFSKALYVGATLVILSREELMPGPGLVRRLVRHRVTRLTLTPSVLAVLPETELETVRTIVAGGEACTEELMDRWAPGRTFYNAYGPTEATVWACRTPCQAGSGRPAIGRGALNKQLYVLDLDGRLMPAGIPGELVIGGVGVARGYLRRPSLTAERFVPDPYRAVRGSRMYRTGDLARWRWDGLVDFLGRTDHQVKIRGFRVEPGEIEAALRGHAAVREAVVLARPDQRRRGELRLTAYVVPRAAPAPAAELRRFLAERLPDYMVPAAFVELERLPLTPSDKLDREALPEPDEREASAVDDGAPRGPEEELLAGIWADVLALGRVGPDDDFFELGGHSLLATRIVSRVREVCEVDFPLAQLFAAPTVAAMAEHVRRRRREGHGVAAPPIRPTPRDGEIELSFAQERLWFLDRLEFASPVYNVASALRLVGELSPPLLERVFAEVVRRHEVLRTRFVEIDGRPRQVIVTALWPELPLIDLRGLPAARRETLARRLARGEARRLFDLAAAPLLRLRLLRLSGSEWVLLATLHHVVADGWSTGVLVREVAALYRAFLAGRPSPLPELPVQYADYARWQRRWLSGEVLASQLAYWRKQLAAAPRRLELPCDRPRAGAARFRGRELPIALGQELSRDLGGLGRRHGTTLYMTLLAVFQALLGRYTGQRGIAVGSPIAGRHHAEIEDLIGFFVNTLVLYADLSDRPSFAALLERVRRTALDAYAHQDLPFERLVEELGPQRDLETSPLFQVMLVVQNAPRARLELPGLELSSLAADTGTAKFDLIVSLQESPEGISGSLNYNPDLFDPTTVRRFLAHYAALLRAAVADPSSRIDAVALLSAAERHQVEIEWNDSQRPGPAGGTLGALLAARCAAAGDAVAVICGDERLSFAELDRRARRLAARLRAAGAGPEVPVAILLERSAELVVALSAAVAAGAPYLPLDPGDPPERLAFLLADGGAAVLLTRPELTGLLPALPPAVRDALAVLHPSESRPAGGGSRAEVDPSHLAYVIYTSGSTGRPKGVMVEHGSLLNYLAWVDRELFGTAADPPPLVTSIAFDASLKQIFVPLLRGRAVRVLPGETVARPAALAAALAASGETALNCVPSLWEAVLEAMAADGAPPPAELRRLFLGGERVRSELLARSRALFPALEIFNLYGPTEATANASYGRLGGAAPPAIGRPLANYRLHVVDSRLRSVPIGVAGELVIGGAGVARGYLGRPRQTAERFVPAAGGGRLYRTGDRARQRGGGELEFLGRRDDQIKLRGFRVELGEIESALLAHPAVDEAAVLAPIGPAAERRLVAYLVAPAAVEGELREFVRRRLPEPMVPGPFVFSRELPRLATGKIDRAALLARPLPESAAETPPRDAVELALARIWEELLGLERVGVRRPFFELGGHSLLAVRLVARIRRQFGRELPLTLLFEGGTIEHLAAALRRRDAPRHGRSALVALRAAGSRPPFFCVHPVGGEVLCYAELARRLAGEHPLYGLQTPLRGGAPLYTEIAEMARHYAAAVEEVGAGPYRLGGWSTGGLVAFEMARQLERRGRRVERLVLLDTLAPSLMEAEPEGADGDRRRALSFVRDVASLFGAAPPPVPEQLAAAATATEILAFAAARFRESGLVPPDFDAAEIHRHFTVFGCNRRAARRYRPRPWDGRAVLVKARELLSPRARAADLGWGELAAGVEVHEAGGDHYSMLREPHVKELARLLDRVLEASRGAAPGAAPPALNT